MRNKAILVIAASLIVSGVASAAIGETGAGSDAPCWKGGSTFAIEECFAVSAKRSDTDLNRTYSGIMSVLGPDDRERLQNAERLWVAYRDAACGAEYHLWGGWTGGPPAQLACIDGETRRHLDYLQNTYRLQLQRLAAPTSSTVASTIAPAADEHREDWHIIRTDYVEFCVSNIATINIADGSLHGSIGACDPRRNGPAREIDARADQNDIAALREALSSLATVPLADESCISARMNAPPTPVVLSGPVSLTIERPGTKVSVNARSPCLTQAGRNLLRLVGRTTEPLRAFGLR